MHWRWRLCCWASSQLMDTPVYYARNLAKGPLPQDKGKVPVQIVQPGEEEGVRQVAVKAFLGYFGHYHAYSRLDRAACDKIYTSWAVRSCLSREVADDVLVANRGDNIVGFISLKLNNNEEGEGRLFAVSPEVQGQGISRSLMVQAMEWFLSRGARRMIISTQITNIGVQKVWVRLGLEPAYAYHTFHKWFDQS